MENNGQSMSDDTPRLLQLIAMFQMAAMQQMGKLPNPVTNEVERDMRQAKASIDLLETIKRKTQGNLIDAEAEFLDKVLFELHMNYVDEAGRAGGEEEKEDTGRAEKGAGSPEAPADDAEAEPGDDATPAPDDEKK